MSKERVLKEIEGLIKTYGKDSAGFTLEYYFRKEGFYMEDRRFSKVDYVIDCVNKRYTDKVKSHREFECNQRITRALINAIKTLD